MPKRPPTIRLDPLLYKKVLREGKKAGLSFSNIVQLLLGEFAAGSLRIGVTRYPQGYLRKLEREAEELQRLYRAGKVKGYTSAKEMFRDILGE